MSKKSELEGLIAAIEKRRLAVEDKRMLFQFETVFFLPLFALLFLVTYLSKSDPIKLFFYLLTIILIIADLIYTALLYKDMEDKQRRLEGLINEKLGQAY